MLRRDGVPLERDTTSRSPLEEVFLFRHGTAAYPAPLLLHPVLDFLNTFLCDLIVLRHAEMSFEATIDLRMHRRVGERSPWTASMHLLHAPGHQRTHIVCVLWRQVS